MSEPKFTLTELTQEELSAFNEALQALVDKHSIHIEAKPAIETDGRLIAKIVVSKKVELAPKEDGTLVQKKDENIASDSDKPEESPVEQDNEELTEGN